MPLEVRMPSLTPTMSAAALAGARMGGPAGQPGRLQPALLAGTAERLLGERVAGAGERRISASPLGAAFLAAFKTIVEDPMTLML